MEQRLRNWFMKFLHYMSIVYTFARNSWNEYRYTRLTTFVRPHAQYFLADTRPFSAMYDTVPDDAVYIEEWIDGTGNKRCVVRYSGDPIPKAWIDTPFTKNARTPWVWVGDRTTEIDLTRTFNKYLVVGNKITTTLVEKLIRVNDRTNLIYIESGTFKELKFPGDGLTIEEYDDQSVSNRG